VPVRLDCVINVNMVNVAFGRGNLAGLRLYISVKTRDKVGLRAIKEQPPTYPINTTIDSLLDNVLLLTIGLMAIWYHETRFDLQPSGRNPGQGESAVEEWLERPTLLYKATGLQLYTFNELVAWVREYTALDNTRYMLLAEKVAIFLYICRYESEYNVTKIVFNRSLNTIFK
jgi:hypothetical protein